MARDLIIFTLLIAAIAACFLALVRTFDLRLALCSTSAVIAAVAVLAAILDRLLR